MLQSFEDRVPIVDRKYAQSSLADMETSMIGTVRKCPKSFRLS